VTTHIKNIINQFLKEKKSEARHADKVVRIVEENLGAELIRHIKLQRIDKKNLIFSSDSSAATYEFGLRKENLLKAVRKEFPNIEGVKIRIGNYD
jgi:hypothetical protein